MRIDTSPGIEYHASMIETLSLLAGLGFSFYVYFRSIRPLAEPGSRKFVYFFFTLIGITGTLFLFGILDAYFLDKWKLTS